MCASQKKGNENGTEGGRGLTINTDINLPVKPCQAETDTNGSLPLTGGV